jgi:hypothetical protein
MESVDYCPMGIVVLRHLGVSPDRHPSPTWPVEGILFLRGSYHTLRRRSSARLLCGGQSFRKLSGGNWMVDRSPCSLAPGSSSAGGACTPLSVNCSALLIQGTLRPSRAKALTIVTWLILPVVICLSQRLSHACLSISNLYGETANGSLNQLSFI